MPRFLQSLGVLTLLCTPFLAMGAHADDTLKGDPELGARLYFQGTDSKGEPIRGVTHTDIPVDGSQMTCVSCHRPSGMGSSEGGTYVPPITASYLFQARTSDRKLRNERFKEVYKERQGSDFYDDVRRTRLRRAYETTDDIAQALRAGVDTAGRSLNPVMPRYELSDEDIANLTAFLKGNYPDYDNGVEADRIHIATIIAGDVNQDHAQAVTDLVETFAEWINKDIKVDLARPGFSPYYRSEFTDSYRLWVPEIWRLTGDPESWDEQLQRYYEKQPAFFVTSSLVQGDYRPIADFCDEKKIPCILPMTDLPRAADLENSFTLYFSRGLMLEAEALATYLNDEKKTDDIVQIHMADAEGTTPAKAFSQKLSALTGRTGTKTLSVGQDGDIDTVLARALSEKPESLVFWSGLSSAKAVAALNKADLGETTVYLPSSSLLDLRESLSDDKREAIRVTYPYDDPKNYHPESFRIRAWIGSRKLAMPDWTMMLQAYYALKVSQFALSHMLSDYYGAYMIELLEHDIGVGFDPGPYPRLQLGPGQRFGSKGALVARLDDSNSRGISSVSRWIIP